MTFIAACVAPRDYDHSSPRIESRGHRSKSNVNEKCVCCTGTAACSDGFQNCAVLWFYPRDTVLARVLAMALCLSLCVSVTSWCSIEVDGQSDPVFGTHASCDQSYTVL